MKKFQRITAFIICFLIVITVCFLLGQRMMPERKDYGATWGQYLAEPQDSLDLLFIGSSIAYCDIVPSIIYDETGIRSYMVCGPELTSSLSYYYLKEALKTQNPQYVMLEATSYFFGQYTGYTKVNVGYMPFSQNRISAIFNSSEKEQRLGLLFPLYNYHSRWNDDQVTYSGKRSDAAIDLNAGYTYVDKVAPQTERCEREYYLSVDQLNENLSWLAKTKELCEKEGVKLILFIAPQCKYPSEELVSRLREAAGELDIVNFNDNFEELELDLENDFHDTLHLNCFGAEKFTHKLATILMEMNFKVTGAQSSLWEERVGHGKALFAE